MMYSKTSWASCNFISFYWAYSLSSLSDDDNDNETGEYLFLIYSVIIIYILCFDIATMLKKFKYLNFQIVYSIIKVLLN